MDPNLINKIAELVILFSFVLSFIPRALFFSKSFFVLYLLGGFSYVFVRYYYAFPMTPMFFGTAGTPPILALLGALYWRRFQKKSGLFFYRSLLLLTFFLGLFHVFFPKDFYLPFLKTATFFSQAHLAFTLLGKAAFFLSGLWALDYLINHKTTSSSPFFLWLVLGFGFWTLCIFTGEAWSYLGWGLPVVWDDAVIVTFLATWFFYIGLLHLHLAGNLTVKKRALFSVGGILWVIVLNCGPDLGPFRWLFR
ncbi:MAG: cytochrome c biogenesis protein [Deltaproteobacteria bacterium]|jgi:hypothetical protein|nr:cytochrome c biogenesis protein [Deltaproteobacteria bacterium]